MITRYLHSSAEWLCEDNIVECFCVPFIGWFSLYLLHNHSLHTDIITEMDFLGERVRLEGEREGEGGEKEREVGKERGSLFSIFSLITNQCISLWRPDHSVGRRMGSFSPLFISLLFNTFPSLLLPGISPVSKCQANKPRNQIPLPPSLLLKQTACSVF